MTFKQLLPITTELKSPFVLTKVPISTFLARRKSVRKRFKCGYKAVAELKALKLNPAMWTGADVADANGRMVAELE